MSEPGKVRAIPDTWDPQSLLAKSQRHADSMAECDKDDWQFGLRSTFALELLGRAALANVSPALLADTQDWNNLLHSLGYEPKARQFIPKSVAITTVFARLKEILPAFTAEIEAFCSSHMNRRNSELHSGSIAFDGTIDQWLPKFYRACELLLASMGKDLAFLFGKEEAAVARKLISAAEDDAAKAVLKSVKAHETIWTEKEKPERNELTQKAVVWATKQDGHRAKCPACGSTGLLKGEATTPPTKKIVGDEITETQEFLPSKYECIACGLKVTGLSHLTACGLGAPFKATFTYDATEYYAHDPDPHAGYEDDQNEP